MGKIWHGHYCALSGVTAALGGVAGCQGAKADHGDDECLRRENDCDVRPCSCHISPFLAPNHYMAFKVALWRPQRLNSPALARLYAQGPVE
jgi:hypothetical protein